MSILPIVHFASMESIKEKPTYEKRQSKDKEVKLLLNRNHLKPGNIIFSYHYESRLPGRCFGGKASKNHLLSLQGGQYLL